MTGSMPLAPCGLMMRTRASPSGEGTVIHSSSTGSFLTGPDCASTRTFLASAGVISYRNGGFENASATCCASGSKTIGLVAFMTVLLTRKPGHGMSQKARREPLVTHPIFPVAGQSRPNGPRVMA
jgi:hypothetical protein